MLWTALLTMVCATIAQHLGLAEKIAQIGSQVMACPKCLSFWATLFVLLVNGCNILCAVGLSLFMAYIANWVGFAYYGAEKLYEILWQRTTRNPDQRPQKKRSNRQ